MKPLQLPHSLLVFAALLLSGFTTGGVAEEKLPESAIVRHSPDGTGVFFDGFIDDKAVAKVEAAANEGSLTTLYIRSSGGFVEAGLRLGEIVRDARLTVVVVGLCASSCANYVFTAGKDRVIEGVVLWHGSAEQKDFREAYLCGRPTSSLFGTKMAVTPEGRASWSALCRRQDEFFSSIGVNEYITRAGQEPVVQPEESFTYEVTTMELFGLANVKAPAGYGTASWCAKLNSGLKRPIACLTVTETMLTYDRLRKGLGEECSPDGTLATRARR